MSDALRNPPSPFLTVDSFATTLEETPAPETLAAPTAVHPFVTFYEQEGVPSVSELQTDEYLGFLSELYEEEMDEAFLELAGEVHELQRGLERERSYSSGPTSERLLEQHLEPLSQEIERLLESVANEYRDRDAATLAEDEVDRFIDRYVPSADLTPRFEEFFGRIGRFFKKVAKGAIGLAKRGIRFVGKIALGPLFSRLKRLIRPLLRRVLRFAIARLPKALQPIAGRLAQRLGLQRESVEREDPAEVAFATDPGEIQQEFNRQITDLLFAESDIQQEVEIERAVADSTASDDTRVSELDDAREVLVQRLGDLRDGEDPTPHLEEFVPVVLGALRLGIRIIGRKRVVRFLARFLSRLVSRLVGPVHAPMLSRAIVDAGLRLVHLEATPQDESRAASEAIANTVEETVRRVAALPDEVLDREDLLEAFALEAFEQAAAANLPPVLSEEAYRARPELREARVLRGTWLLMPLRGRKRYKKYSQVVRTRITPQQASEIETSEGPLSDTFEEQLGLAPGSDVEAEVHLYETIPGGNLANLADYERDVIGPVGSAEAHGGLHPLTPEAASVLLREPGLGREVDHELDSEDEVSPLDARPGRRYFALRVPGVRPPIAPAARGRVRLRRTSRVRLVLDSRAGQIRLHVYLGEARAQAIAERVRQKQPTGPAIALIRRIVQRRLRQLVLGRTRGILRIVHETVPSEQFVPSAFRRLPVALFVPYVRRIRDWTLNAINDSISRQGEAFVQATQDPADGVTIIATIASPPGFTEILRALKGTVTSLAGIRIPDGAPKVNVVIRPGYVRG